MARPEIVPAAPDEPARLLHADEERLRLAAVTLLRGGRFVLVVADNRLWLAATRFLHELLPDHRFVEHAPTSHDEANQAISDPLRNEPGLTLVLRITGRDAGPIETLNLRRESLVKAAANFLVVLDGDAAHGRFLREAPDCYSYRDLLIVLEGEPKPAIAEHDGNGYEFLDLMIENARQEQADPRTRARRLFQVARLLQQNHQTDRARELLDEAITAMAPERVTPDDDDRAFLAGLYYYSADGSSRTERYRRVRAARDVLIPAANEYSAQLANIESQMVDAIGVDLEAAFNSVRRAREGRGGSLNRQLFCLAQAYRGRDNLVRAREALAEIDMTDIGIRTNLVHWIKLQFNLLLEEGRWAEADKLISSGERAELEDPDPREQLDGLRAKLLRRRGEGHAAERIYERMPPSTRRELAMIWLAADGGRMHDAGAQLEHMLDRLRTTEGSEASDLIAAQRLLVYLTERNIATGGFMRLRETLDSRLAVLRLHIERTEDPDPPWSRIDCLLVQADAYLKRTGAEQLALSCAGQAWQLASAGATLLEPRAARRCAVAALRLGKLGEARDWLSRGLARAREHDLRGDEAELSGLALWHATLAAGDTAAAETDLRAAIAATGSKLIEASVLARVGSALGRHDLLRQAQQIYRSLPWPAREGACLEALGETQIAEARYRTFGLVTQAAILARRSGPPPITAVDDD